MILQKPFRLFISLVFAALIALQPRPAQPVSIVDGFTSVAGTVVSIARPMINGVTYAAGGVRSAAGFVSDKWPFIVAQIGTTCERIWETGPHYLKTAVTAVGAHPYATGAVIIVLILRQLYIHRKEIALFNNINTTALDLIETELKRANNNINVSQMEKTKEHLKAACEQVDTMYNRLILMGTENQRLPEIKETITASKRLINSSNARLTQENTGIVHVRLVAALRTLREIYTNDARPKLIHALLTGLFQSALFAVCAGAGLADTNGVGLLTAS